MKRRLRHATDARQDGGEYVLDFADGSEVCGDRLLLATGRAPRSDELGLERVGVAPGRAAGCRWDARQGPRLECNVETTSGD